MDNVKLLIFRMHKQENPLYKEGTTYYNSDELIRSPLLWNKENADSAQLSHTLDNQIVVNFLNLSRILLYCETEEEFIPTTFNYVDAIPQEKKTYTREYKLDPETKKMICKKYNIMHPSYDDVLSRDLSALNQENFNVELHTVVVLYKREYHGHIYCWISPSDSSICLAMGIRSGVDSLLLKAYKDELKNASHYLLEGVRQFAFYNNCEKIIIPQPLPAMRNILLSLKFANFYIGKSASAELLGTSLPQKYSCGFNHNCYEREIETPFIDLEKNPIDIKIIE